MKKVAEFKVLLLVEGDPSNNQITDLAQRLRGAGYGWFRRHKARGTVVVERVSLSMEINK
jgi:hypothetical protein